MFIILPRALSMADYSQIVSPRMTPMARRLSCIGVAVTSYSPNIYAVLDEPASVGKHLHFPTKMEFQARQVRKSHS